MNALKKKWQIYTVEYYSAIKKNEMMSFAGLECRRGTVWGVRGRRKVRVWGVKRMEVCYIHM
jgi:hypothetical protein